MLDELNTVISEYWTKWQALVAARKNKAFFEALTPTTVCWKAVDLADYDRRLAELRDHADHIHTAWLNERWLTTLHLRQEKLEHGIEIVKLYQRRPGSTDATGLDHLDFYFKPGTPDAKELLGQESNLKWTEETNGEFCEWLSIWFEKTEAKLRSETTFDVIIKELEAINRGLSLAGKE
jgi:hypothetical protein